MSLALLSPWFFGCPCPHAVEPRAVTIDLASVDFDPATWRFEIEEAICSLELPVDGEVACEEGTRGLVWTLDPDGWPEAVLAPFSFDDTVAVALYVDGVLYDEAVLDVETWTSRPDGLGCGVVTQGTATF